MNAQPAYIPEPSARADTDEMRAAMFLASAKNLDYCDALEQVRAERYAADAERYAAEQSPCEVITHYALRRGE